MPTPTTTHDDALTTVYFDGETPQIPTPTTTEGTDMPELTTTTDRSTVYDISPNQIDVAVRAASAYRRITKGTRTLLGQQIVALLHYANLEGSFFNEHAAQYPEFQSFPRKVKRAANHQAIKGILDAILVGNPVPLVQESEVVKILSKTLEKNATSAGYRVTMSGSVDEGYEVTVTAADAFQEALDTDPDTVRYGFTDAERDPDSEDYDLSLMVRPWEIIQAERAEEAERIRAERMAVQAERVAAAAATDDDDDDDDDWDLDEEGAAGIPN